MSQQERRSFIGMLNTSIGSISGLFKSKKDPEAAVDAIVPVKEKEKDQTSFLSNEEEEFEKDLSKLSISLESPKENTSHPEEVQSENVYSLDEGIPTTAETELIRMKKILTLKEEIRAKEKEKEKEAVELKILEIIKVQTHLDYERKQRKILEQEIMSLKKRLEESELECMELIKYCKMLLSYEKSPQLT
ncbi:hypothetical protein NEOKW01_0346 [Nematocida sp. AWRm80]|nr:hypothetical protein NEOKW01_0346 [Nematocida sp. AWRm80]